MSEWQFTGHYERKFSDGNYGSEGLSLGVTVVSAFDENEPDQQQIVRDLRQIVLGFLATSANGRVAHEARWELEKLTAPQEPVTVGDLEDLPY